MRKFLDKISKKHYMQCLLSIILTEGILGFTSSLWHNKGMQIDWCRLIIFAVVAFMLMYKFVQYLSKFKIEKNHSRIDIVFLAVFFIVLFLPMSNISDALKSKHENRMLAKKPQLIIAGGMNNYGEKFDAWFNDRFWGRESIISLYSMLKFHISRVYINGGSVYLSSNGWMFNNTDIHIPNKNVKKEIIQELNKLYEFCITNNIKLYLLITPAKPAIYHEILKKNYEFNISSLNSYNDFIKELQNKMSFPVIYPYEELIKAKDKDFVFFKQSHHWTDWGAYNGYVPLINTIKKDFSDIEVVTLSNYTKFTDKLIRDDWNRNFNLGHTTRLLKIDEGYAKEHLLKDDYICYDHKNADNIIFNKKKYIKNFEQKNKGKYKLFLIGNSQNENLLQFLPYSVHQLKYLRVNRGQLKDDETYKILKHYKKEILDFKPDIMVLSISATKIRDLRNLTKEK